MLHHREDKISGNIRLAHDSSRSSSTHDTFRRNEDPLARAFQKSEMERGEVNISILQDIASQLRDGLPCACLEQSENDNFRAYNLVFNLQFVDGIVWIARLPAICRAIRPFNDKVYQQTMQSMIDTMLFVDQNTSLPVPRIYGFDVTCENDLGRPYVIMSKSRGEPLWDFINQDWKQYAPAFRKIIRQWGTYSMELASFRFKSIGSLRRKVDGRFEITELNTPYNLSLETKYDSIVNRGPFKSTADYLLAQSDVKRHLNRPHLPSFGGHLRMSLVESFLGYFLDLRFLNGPFVLSHTNLEMQNILVDINRGEITGIIDWDFAAVLPLQSHIVLPRSLNAEFLPASEFAEFEDQYPYMVDFSRKYRQVYEQSMISAAPRFGLNYPIEDLLDRSLMYGLFEKAISYMPDEKYLPALWNHVYGGDLVSQEKMRNEMRKGHWAGTMADKWNVEIQIQREENGTETHPRKLASGVIASERSTHRQSLSQRWKSSKRRWIQSIRSRSRIVIERTRHRGKERNGAKSVVVKSEVIIRKRMSWRRLIYICFR
jgi:hypothetical protein